MHPHQYRRRLSFFLKQKSTAWSIFILTCIAIPATGKCQDEGVFNRINGVKIKNSVYIYIEKDLSLSYTIDDENIRHPLDDAMIFNIKNNHKNDFQVYFQFYNPLRASVKSSQKNVDDPSYKAIADFVSKLPAGPSSVVNNATDKAPLKGSDGMADLEYNILLYEWTDKFYNSVKPKYIHDKKLVSEYNDIVLANNALGRVESFLYGEFTLNIDNSTKTVSGWVKGASSDLFKAEDDLDTFTVVLNNSEQISDALVAMDKETTKSLKDMQDLLTKNFDNKIGILLDDSAVRANFKKYSDVFARKMTGVAQPQFSAQEAIIAQGSALNTRLKTFCKDFKGEVVKKVTQNPGFKKDFTGNLDWKNQSMTEISYTVTSLNQDGTEDLKKSFSRKFNIAKRLGLYPFISTGVIYTDFSYPEYAVKTDNGSNTVAKTDDVKVNFRPTVFLNFLISNWGVAYPFAQIGITTGNNDALFPVGFGIAMGSSFSFSFGAIFGYHKDLTKLSVGGSVKDDAELKADLSNKALFRPYFSINYNLGKK